MKPINPKILLNALYEKFGGVKTNALIDNLKYWLKTSKIVTSNTYIETRPTIIEVKIMLKIAENMLRELNQFRKGVKMNVISGKLIDIEFEERTRRHFAVVETDQKVGQGSTFVRPRISQPVMKALTDKVNTRVNLVGYDVTGTEFFHPSKESEKIEGKEVVDIATQIIDNSTDKAKAEEKIKAAAEKKAAENDAANSEQQTE